jgi:hypothetical protein
VHCKIFVLTVVDWHQHDLQQHFANVSDFSYQKMLDDHSFEGLRKTFLHKMFYYVTFLQIILLPNHRMDTFTEINRFHNKWSIEKSEINSGDTGYIKLYNH